MKVAGYAFLMFMSFIFGLCVAHSNLKEGETVVKKIESGTLEHRYKYAVEAFPDYQCYYTDSIFEVGDTLVFVKK